MPASAVACPTADGVTVVVDFHELGGGVQTACVADGGGRTASDLFPTAGFPLSYVQRQPGFVCRVEGKPADDPCVNTPPSDAYWGLFWSDGRSGSWTYSTIGAGGLRVPDGGYVAFSWNGSSARATPGYSPAAHPTPTPTPSPTHSAHPSAHPSPQHSGSVSATPSTPAESVSASASESPNPSKGAKSHDRKSHSAAPSATGSPTPSSSPSASPDAVPASAEPADPDGGLPGWVAPTAVVVLFGAVGAAAVVRRRRSGAA
jgi:hypothetical protein